MFKVALFTITKMWKPPKCPSTDEWSKEDVVHTFSGTLSHKNYLVFSFCRSLISLLFSNMTLSHAWLFFIECLMLYFKRIGII